MKREKQIIRLLNLFLLIMICSCSNSKLTTLNGEYKINCTIIPYIHDYKVAISTPNNFNSNYKSVKKEITFKLSLNDIKLVDATTSFDLEKGIDIRNKLVFRNSFGKKTIIYVNNSEYVLFNDRYYKASKELISLLDFIHSSKLLNYSEGYKNS